ncbi:MAG: low molecular weight protein-tyrosine-phosphatase [Phycisphaerales bacterium]
MPDSAAPNSPDSDAPIGVLFVCLGNICRSPLAEGVFRHKAARRGAARRFDIDSAGTGGWHAGELADPRMRETAMRRGVTLESRARQIVDADFDRFHHILCMDDDNLDRVRTAGAPFDRTRLLLDVVPEGAHRTVPDPYYGGGGGFELVYALVDLACDRWLEQWLNGGRPGPDRAAR